MCMEVEGARPRERRTRKTCLEVVRIDMKELGLASTNDLVHHAWKR